MNASTIVPVDTVDTGLFVALSSVIIALAVIALVCTIVALVLSSRRYEELKLQLDAIKNKPLVAPVVNIEAPSRPAAPVASPVSPPLPVPVSAHSVSVSVAAPAPAPRKVPASFSRGDVKLHTVPDKTAAMLMAIVADEMKVPINELRFISIKEI